MALQGVGQEVDYTIKPAASAPAPDTSDWPLLLKNYSNCRQTPLLLLLLR